MDEILKAILALVGNLDVATVVNIGHTEVLVPDLKVMEMGVRPAHRDLDGEEDCSRDEVPGISIVRQRYVE